MNHRTIRIAFTDFWEDFDPESWFLPLFRRVLGEKRVIAVSNPQQADILIFSVFGLQHLRFQQAELCRVFFTGENFRHDSFPADYAISFDWLKDHPRHTRLPVWEMYDESVSRALQLDAFRRWNRETAKNTLPRTKFCGWVASFEVEVRNQFVQLLSQAVSPVACGGSCLNNVGGPVPDKDVFLQQCRFAVAIENSQYPGYCTEKLLQSFLAGCIPIYWGDPLVTRDFNPEAFLRVENPRDLEPLFDQIRYLESSRDALHHMRAQPIFTEEARLRLTLEKSERERTLIRRILSAAPTSSAIPA